MRRMLARAVGRSVYAGVRLYTAPAAQPPPTPSPTSSASPPDQAQAAPPDPSLDRPPADTPTDPQTASTSASADPTPQRPSPAAAMDRPSQPDHPPLGPGVSMITDEGGLRLTATSCAFGPRGRRLPGALQMRLGASDVFTDAERYDGCAVPDRPLPGPWLWTILCFGAAALPPHSAPPPPCTGRGGSERGAKGAHDMSLKSFVLRLLLCTSALL